MLCQFQPALVRDLGAPSTEDIDYIGSALAKMNVTKLLMLIK